MLAFAEEILEQVNKSRNAPVEWDEETGWPSGTSPKYVEASAKQMRQRLQRLLAELGALTLG